MPFPRVEIVRHLGPEALIREASSATRPVERRRWLAVAKLYSGERSTAEVAAAVGLSARQVRWVVGRWNELGPAGLVDGRAENGGGRG